MSNDFGSYKIYAQLACASYNNNKTSNMSLPKEYVEVDQYFIAGFKAILYKNTLTGEKVLAIRGTDIEASLNSIDDLYNDLQLALAGVNLQELDLEKYYNKLIGQDIVSPNEKITVVGHSLGGYLAQILTLKHPEVVDRTYTFNAPGIGGLPGTLLNALGIENIYNPKITDVVAKDGLSLIAGTGLNVGQEIEVSGETHFIAPMTKILYFYDFAISHGISEEFVTNYLSSYYKNIVSSMTGEGITNIAEKIIQDIDKTIGKAQGKSDIIDICQIYDSDKTNFTLELIPFNAPINQIFPDSNISIEKLYALVNLNNFIISDIDLPAYKELEKYKDEYSDNYVKDKSKMLQKVLISKAVSGEYYKDYQSNEDPYKIINNMQLSSLYFISAKLQLEAGLRLDDAINSNKWKINDDNSITILGSKNGLCYNTKKLSDKTIRQLRLAKEAGYYAPKNAYVKDLKAAGADSRGTHGLRYNFAQRRYEELRKEGMSHIEALAQVSIDMGHSRVEITRHYLVGL